MSADIVKAAVYDDRIVQSRPQFAVEKGALSLSNTPFSAISQTSSQHTYQIYAPSENVFIDRALEWTSTFLLTATVSFAGGGLPAANAPLRVIGKDIALCAFPLNSLLSTMTATINDTTVTVNSEDVLDKLLRLTDYKENRLQRTCPTALDNYLNYFDGLGTINTPLGSYSSQTGHEYTPNGAYPFFEFTDQAGAPLVGGGNYPNPAGGGNVNYLNGVPVSDGVTTAYTLYFRVRSTEKLTLSPFVFADKYEWDTGLFGINNISLVMNLKSPSRIIRNAPTTAATANTGALTGIAFNTSTPFANSRVNVQFLTPSLSIDLPPKSVVPYMEYPRYISPTTGSIGAGQTSQIQSQTITLPQIPDMLIVFARPVAVAGSTVNPSATNFADGLLPLATGYDNVNQPLSVNFDNFSGLLSAHTTEELYAMCVHNGLEMDWATWIGRGYKSGANVVANVAYGAQVSLCGGPLVLRMGHDITLQEGQAASLVGNFTLQMNVTVRNPYADSIAAQLVIITVNSGFLESIRGSSRIIKGVLSEQDIISAPMAAAGTRSEMARVVGSGFFSSLGNAMMKAKDIYQKSKPIVSAVKGALPEGQVKSMLGSLGYGTGAGMHGMGTGAAIGAGRRGKKSLEARLM